MQRFRVRTARVADLDVLVHHRHMMFESMEHPTPEQQKVGDDSFREWAPAMMKKRLLRCRLVIDEKGEIAGGGCIWLRDVQPGPGRKARKVPYLLSMYTEPKFRRKGVAAMIVEDHMQWAKRHEYRKMTLHASETGRKVYSKLGWVRTWEMEVDLKPQEHPTTRIAAPE